MGKCYFVKLTTVLISGMNIRDKCEFRFFGGISVGFKSVFIDKYYQKIFQFTNNFYMSCKGH